MHEQKDTINLKDLWAIVLKRRWVVVAFFSVLVVIVGIGTIVQTPLYRATATIAIMPERPKVLQFQEVDEISGGGSYWMYQDYFNTQLRIIRSVATARAVVDRLGLTVEAADGSIVPMPLGRIVANMDVDAVRDSQIVRISYTDPDPQQAADIAQTIAEVYMEQNLNHRVDLTRQAVDWLSERLTELKQDLVANETKIFDFKNENRLVTLDERYNLLLHRLVEMNNAHARLLTARVELEARWRQIDQLIKSGADLEALTAVIQSQLIQNLKARAVDLERERSELAQRYLPEHPRMQRVERQIAHVHQSIRKEVGKIVAAVRNEYTIKKAEEESLARALETAKQEALDLNKKLIAHMSLQHESEKNQQLYDILLGRLKETDITSEMRATNIRLLDRAEAPPYPVSPRVAVNLALALLVGLVGGIGLAFFFEYVDNTVKTQEDVEKILQMPLLGVIPSILEKEEPAAYDRHVHLHPKSTMAESCRAIRTNLNFIHVERPLTSLVVTSATPLEGKSTTCCNLGITMAQAGQRVLLVDTDLRRSRLHKAFELDNTRGFSNLLSGEYSLDAVVQATEVPNLWVITSGPLPPNPSELLGSSRMDEVVSLLTQRYDRVIFDSPPILPVTDAIVMSRKVAGTIYIIKAGKVSKEMAAEARRRLVEVDAKVLGAVLNDVDVASGGYSAQYQYYYAADDERAS
jgi:polysaccharide biosynthesis transport protein